MAGIIDIAKASGVSRETVSRILNGKYKGRTEKSRAIMQWVRKEAGRINYRLNNAARTMRTTSSRLIGIVIEEKSLMTHPVITETLKGINEILEESDYMLTITSLSGIRESTLESRIFKEHLLDGIIIVDNIDSARARMMKSIIPACIMVNMNYWEDRFCVRRDEYDAGRTAGSELLQLGYKRALYFDFDIQRYSNKIHHYSAKDRISGFKAGFEGNKTEIVVIKDDPTTFHEYLEKNLNAITPYTVLVAANNLRLFSLTSALSCLSLKAGNDCGLVSLDDETGFLRTFPFLSRVSFPRMEIGRIAGQMIVSLLKGDAKKCASTKIKGKWIAGTTTRNLNAKMGGCII